MSFIDKNLLPNERIIFRTKKHLIIFLMPSIYLLAALFFTTDIGWSHTFNTMLANAYSTAPAAIFMARLPLIVFTGAAIFTGIRQWLTYATSDYVITNMRVVMKQGFFDRYITDTRLVTISHVMVEQSLVGQILNYGTIIINNFGATRDLFIRVSKPNEFQKNVQGQLLQQTNAGGNYKS